MTSESDSTAPDLYEFLAVPWASYITGLKRFVLINSRTGEIVTESRDVVRPRVVAIGTKPDRVTKSSP